MKIRFGTLLLFLLLASATAGAIEIDQATFVKNGGDMSDVGRTIGPATHKLRTYSLSKEWLAVGRIRHPASGHTCTATWLGDRDEYPYGQKHDRGYKWSYFLTAAHCANVKSTETLLWMQFIGWNGEVIADGYGWIYAPQQEPAPTSDKPNPATDIAIVKLPYKQTLLNRMNGPVEQPVLNDSFDEAGKDVIFIGYGQWGIAGTVWDRLTPRPSARRMYGRNKIHAFYRKNRALLAYYDPIGPSTGWASLTDGDSGSAWWQIRNNMPVIVATASGTIGNASAGTRVSHHAAWIKSIYSDARFLSDVPRARGCIVSMSTGVKYCRTVDILGMSGGVAKLPGWIYRHDVYVQVDSGVSVMLSDNDIMSPTRRAAMFYGTTEHAKLKRVKANNNQYIDLTKPRSMYVYTSYRPIGCIVSLFSGEKYCLSAGQRSGEMLPDWIYGHDVIVQTDRDAHVVLSDFDNLSYNRLASFNGRVEHEDLKRVRADNGEFLDFSRPHSMKVTYR